MREKLEQRLESLKAEFASGQQILADLEAKQTNLRNTLLRISGAIQVIEELLTEANSSENGVGLIETLADTHTDALSKSEMM